MQPEGGGHGALGCSVTMGHQDTSASAAPPQAAAILDPVGGVGSDPAPSGALQPRPVTPAGAGRTNSSDGAGSSDQNNAAADAAVAAAAAATANNMASAGASAKADGSPNAPNAPMRACPNCNRAPSGPSFTHFRGSLLRTYWGSYMSLSLPCTSQTPRSQEAMRSMRTLIRLCICVHRSESSPDGASA